MKPYDQIFNPQYVNPQYYEAIQKVANEYEARQQKEIANAVHAIHDFFEATRKIDPQHQQAAMAAIIAEILNEQNRK